jgi:hypothetical protein
MKSSVFQDDASWSSVEETSCSGTEGSETEASDLDDEGSFAGTDNTEGDPSHCSDSDSDALIESKFKLNVAAIAASLAATPSMPHNSSSKEASEHQNNSIADAVASIFAFPNVFRTCDTFSAVECFGFHNDDTEVSGRQQDVWDEWGNVEDRENQVVVAVEVRATKRYIVSYMIC